jgi:hypothetical protein
MDQDPKAAFEKVADDVRELANCVAKFANWWSKAESMIHILENQAVSADRPRLSTIRITLVRRSCEVLQKDYEVYRRSVSNLQLPPAEPNHNVLLSDGHFK